MSIENLDDSCLFRIFREINDKKTLLVCSLVNRRWHSLIFPKTVPQKNPISGRITLNERKTRIIDDWEIVVQPYESKPDILIQHGRKIKQLYIKSMALEDFEKYVKHLPRLERLHLSSSSDYAKPCERYDGRYNGRYDEPKLERLQILEINARANDFEEYRGFSFMDRCPSLKSAFHLIHEEYFFVDTQVINYSLEDLVIEDESYHEAIEWSTLKKILRKCPNLKHLAIRHFDDSNIEDENIPEILELLPKVVLIDLRVSPGVTDISADYVGAYCKLHNRSISFYYTQEHRDDIRADWPQLSDQKSQLCLGYSFMKHCFLKYFSELPRFMDPTYLLPLLKDKDHMATNR